MKFKLACWVAAAIGWFVGMDSARVISQDEISFSQDVQPLLAKNCYQCHGAAEQEADLRLDQEESAKEFAIVPGKPEESELLARITTDDESMRMPPEGKPLAAEDVEIIRQWIQQGAKFEGHWAFQPIRKPEPPEVQNEGWVQNPIDRFVLAKLEKAGLKPAPPADRISLIRRAYYDLIGLPPTPEQVDQFVNDASPEAFEKVIDELLASPHYGEKWGRHWLDLVRYAETNGYERDSNKELIWKYRDYVIRSFNEDKPYDRFVWEQLAGDEMPNSDPDSVTATGMMRLGIWDDEPADRELARYDYLDDIVRTTGESLLGLTIGCARCHDHKIDPISQKDYYAMVAFFANISPHGAGKANLVPIATAQDQQEFEEKLRAKQQLEASLNRQIEEIEQELLKKLREKFPQVQIETGDKELDAQVILPDSRKEPQTWEYTFSQPEDHWFQIAFDDSQWKKGPGGFGTQGTPGSVVRTTWDQKEIWMRIDFRLTEIPSTLSLSIHHDEDAEVYLNGRQIAKFQKYTRDYQTVDVSGEALEVLQTGKNTLAIHCRQTGGGQYIDVGLSGCFGGPSLRKLALEHGAELIGKERIQKWNELREQFTKSKSTKLERNTELAMAVTERGDQKTWILGRGSPHNKGEEVSIGFPELLNPPQPEISEEFRNRDSSGRRTALAEWIVSDSNPMTARVAVNRLWQFHFGRGIVRTSSDFGFQGTPPTHPKLLDWLATRFVESGWKMKEFHKLVMLSATYQMSSLPNEKAYTVDPVNDLFWRFDMRRLSAEEVRDSILAVSGTLNPKMFGPSVYPPLPREVLATASRPDAAWGNSSPEDAARRTIYVHVKRSLRPPLLANFDVPDTDTPCAVRMTTTVPTQALGMLNSEFINQQARLFAERLRSEHPDNREKQIELAIRLTTGRDPVRAEIDRDNQFIQSLIEKENLDEPKAMQNYALLILNTNEFFYLN